MNNLGEKIDLAPFAEELTYDEAIAVPDAKDSYVLVNKKRTQLLDGMLTDKRKNYLSCVKGKVIPI